MKTYVLVLRSYDFHQFDSVEFATTNWVELVQKADTYKLPSYIDGSEGYLQNESSLCCLETPHLVVMEFGV